jgi:hypothetical protein
MAPSPPKKELSKPEPPRRETTDNSNTRMDEFKAEMYRIVSLA